uniref:Uncharacterized protein n=1 Tax=Eutreptiella gymnastica TaxID=73025 RepID=A0A7S4GLF6_9EUGL|mmetsp:Transcript_14156/g.23605  ORF Transcript_14156/g.23605 Transcript_14156/m.23605 type:complete len:120 (+) Transcript_14156:866-1225(+)
MTVYQWRPVGWHTKSGTVATQKFTTGVYLYLSLPLPLPLFLSLSCPLCAAMPLPLPVLPATASSLDHHRPPPTFLTTHQCRGDGQTTAWGRHHKLSQGPHKVWLNHKIAEEGTCPRECS